MNYHHIVFVKYFILILFYLIPNSVQGQNWSKINADFGLSDSLTHPVEIRIYQSIETTNYNSLFIIFKDADEIWRSELHEHWGKAEGFDKIKAKKSELTSKHDIEYIYTKLLSSYIFELPSEEAIHWKLEKREKIDSLGVYAKAADKKYIPLSLRTSVLDGVGYSFMAKNSNKVNYFEYSNPERYHEIYPEIDELAFVVELIDIVREGFGIWLE